MIILFLLSIAFLLLISYIKAIELLSIYGFFTAFSFLYNMTTYFGGEYQHSHYSLSYDSSLINSQLLVVGMSNVAYGLVYWLFNENVMYQENIRSNPAERRWFLFFCLILFLILLPIVIRYGWHATSALSDTGIENIRSGIFPILSSYIKFLFVSSFLYYMYKHGINYGTVFLIVLHTIIVIVDGGRTTYMPLLVLALVLYKSKLQKKGVRKFYNIYMYLGLMALIVVLTRALFMDHNASIIDNALNSIMVEGISGSYMSLQAIHAINYGYVSWYTLGGSYIFDPFLWFIPQGDLRENSLILSQWAMEISPILYEKFAPMGGFYYIAEAMAAFSYLGPIIITSLFGYVTISIEKNKNKHKILYFSYFITFGLLFSKAIFGLLVKLFVIQLVFLGFFVIFDRVKAGTFSLRRISKL